jgi:hypothetical protein
MIVDMYVPAHLMLHEVVDAWNGDRLGFALLKAGKTTAARMTISTFVIRSSVSVNARKVLIPVREIEPGSLMLFCLFILNG